LSGYDSFLDRADVGLDEFPMQRGEPDDSNRTATQVLLPIKILIGRQQNIKGSSFSQGKQLAVFDAGSTHKCSCDYFEFRKGQS
jgi:hypothetical protein